ncbi:MucBP domain-containing protein [Lentilactobacillus sp. SPB1-3]|uniref:MucBP domain-containing protein n=1 Tax=Lentilactobacillus terminaliae TaxID=3003483 RepID=A0ACD5DG08_9LACO|nr:MucBP domain-containing protein [Lentilactobacillus sp. SPB1-3]MCZ0976848.1 MucBP domain-containing protein [Lentilactobacillus sp. SPB1-3]
MAFMGWINQRINRFSKRAKQRNRFSKRPRKQHPAQDSTPTSSTIQSPTPKEQLTEEDKTTQKVNLPEPLVTSVTIFYLDANGNFLHDPDILVGKSGTVLNLRLPKFDDYILVDVDGFSNRFKDNDQSITFYYTLKFAAPIKIYSIDLDTSAMLSPVSMVSGKLNQLYDISAPKVAGYKVTNSIGKKYGYFSTQSHDVVFYYRHEQWQTVQPVEYYIRLQSTHSVYERPNGNTALKSQLPNGLIIKVFLKVVTQDNQTWYNIGGTQWINGSQSIISDAPTEIEAVRITKLISQSTELSGYIDYVDEKMVNLYDQPYGHTVQRVANGTQVKITRILIDDQQIKWYLLGQKAVIPARYVILN